MNNIFLPLVGGEPAPVRMGWACYASPHAAHHAQMAKGRPLQNWYARACCMAYPTFYPSLHGPKWWQPIHEVAALAKAYPGHTWLLWNEPHRPDQENITPEHALRITLDWIGTIGKYGRIAGYGLAIDDQRADFATWRHWQWWLEEFLHRGAPLPDAWHFHAYNWSADAQGQAGVDNWRRKYDTVQEWNLSHGNLPMILSEVGETPEVFAALRTLRDPRLEAMLWFTDFTRGDFLIGEL